MNAETTQIEVADGIARLRLNRPDKRNAINLRMHEEIRVALKTLAQRDARVLLITGNGPAFCAGQDLSERVPVNGQPPDLGTSIEQNYKPLCLAIRALPIPVVAAVNGVAAGAGANIALACDVVIAARSASFIQSFCRLGLVPDSGGTWALPHLIGNARALGLTLLGEPLSAQQAEEWGLIWRCVEDTEFAATVERVLGSLAKGPTRGLAQTKSLIYAAAALTYDQQLDLERDAQAQLGRSEDYAEGIRAFFEKRTPRFEGR